MCQTGILLVNRAPRPRSDAVMRSILCLSAAVFVWSYALLVAGWFLGYLTLGDRLWLWAVLNSFPALLFLPVPLVILAAAAARKRAVWAAAVLPVLLWLALFGWRYLPRTQRAGATGSELRVMAFNVLVTNTNADAIVSAIAAGQPDLIAVAELSTIMQARLDQRLAATYPYRILQRLPGASFGSAIYSRWALTDLGSLKTGSGSAPRQPMCTRRTACCVSWRCTRVRRGWTKARWTRPRTASRRTFAAARRNWLRCAAPWTTGAIAP